MIIYILIFFCSAVYCHCNTYSKRAYFTQILNKVYFSFLIQCPNNRIFVPHTSIWLIVEFPFPRALLITSFNGMQWTYTCTYHVYIYHTKKSASIPLAHRFMHKLVVDCCIYQFITANSTIYQGWMDYLVDRFETEKCVCLAPEYFLCISYVNARDCWRGRIFVANEGTLGGFRHVYNISNNSSNSGIVHRWNIGADDDTSWIRRFADAPNSTLKFVPTTMAVENRPTVYRSHAIER